MTSNDQPPASSLLKTLIFEKQTGLSISQFKSTAEIDRVVESIMGRALPISRLGETSRIVFGKGNYFRMKRYNIEDTIDRELSHQ